MNSSTNPSSIQIKPRNLKKVFYGTLLKLPKDLEKQKTVVVGIKKRLYISKYKRFYFKTFKYQVHCDINDEQLNKKGVKELKIGQEVGFVNTRRISATKSSVLVL